MSPKKPTMTAARKEWLASLKIDDKALCWLSGWNGGWYEMTLERRHKDYLQFVYQHPTALAVRATVALGGCSTEGGKLSTVIFPADDPAAQRGFACDTLRRSFTRSIRWEDVSDAAVEQIAQIISADKEPRP